MQTRMMSLIETLVSIAVGFFLSLALQVYLMHLHGVQFSFAQNVEITMYFTILSIVRSYVLRRVFNHFTRGQA